LKNFIYKVLVNNKKVNFFDIENLSYSLILKIEKKKDYNQDVNVNQDIIIHYILDNLTDDYNIIVIKNRVNDYHLLVHKNNLIVKVPFQPKQEEFKYSEQDDFAIFYMLYIILNFAVKFNKPIFALIYTNDTHKWFKLSDYILFKKNIKLEHKFIEDLLYLNYEVQYSKSRQLINKRNINKLKNKKENTKKK
jgi:hypothetical protein